MRPGLANIRFSDALAIATLRRASDIHFSPGSSSAIRVDGDLQFLPGSPIAAEETLALAEHLLDDAGSERMRQRGDASATWCSEDGQTLRVHAFIAAKNVHLALRLLHRRVPSLDELHMPHAVSSLAERHRGLVLFAGPTGAGKSTSLAALLGDINKRQSRRIITIEDPIEYRHESDKSCISQREVGRDVPDFSSAVTGALRADPDVIMIGEMREAATMRAAITAAETGHLVLSTLHTGDAVQTIDRIIDAFEGEQQAQIRSQLSSALVAVVCQRLVARARGGGRCLAAEILFANDAVRATIREGRTHQLRNTMLTGRQSGMQTLEHHLSELMQSGLIDRSSAEAVSERHGELRAGAGAPA